MLLQVVITRGRERRELSSALRNSSKNTDKGISLSVNRQLLTYANQISACK